MGYRVSYGVPFTSFRMETNRFVECPPIGVYRTTVDGLILDANAAFTTLLGADAAADVIGSKITTHVVHVSGSNFDAPIDGGSRSHPCVVIFGLGTSLSPVFGPDERLR
ncbi:hypothetical protein SAMN05192561_102101 [Halopenitus malekzadehii]|uniref:PAS domain-containing protein n=1 Tax=Halopenitus malekzadehii TaxID=1267564 RepID=A0A1H6IBE6_9EURY|nr:hypothetical protein [Halopenitus malekzadehii]SEH45988.1 hypothetical protein SAMN05192561_102101 [Halopenitus malekzadehii]